MKTTVKILFLLTFCCISLALSAQEDCIVLKPEISGKYTGKCKNGLAQGKGKAEGKDVYEGQFIKGLPHGMGIYFWANGDIYTGEWEQGYRQGEGTLNFKINGKDSVMAGLWEKDLYKGPKPPKPRVIYSTSVDRYTFTKSGGIKDRVLINIYQNGMRNLDLENFMIVSSSGTMTNLGEAIGYENISFPVTIKVNYTTWNKVRTVRMYAIFEFEIFEPADWVVDIHN